MAPRRIFVDVRSAAVKDVAHIRAVRQQPAVLRRPGDVIDGRHMAACGLHNDGRAMHGHEAVSRGNQATTRSAAELLDHTLDVGIAADRRR